MNEQDIHHEITLACLRLLHTYPSGLEFNLALSHVHQKSGELLKAIVAAKKAERDG